MDWLRESTVYKAIFEEGRIQGLDEARAERLFEAKRFEAKLLESELKVLRWVLLGLGSDKFGPPDAETASRIEQIDTVGVLAHVIRDVPRADCWKQVRGLTIPF